jgi:hypothetical protein
MVTTEVGDYREGEVALGLLRRFLSAVTWSTSIGLTESLSFVGTTLGLVGRGPLDLPFRAMQPAHTNPIWAPEPSNARALLALALHREGRANSNPAFQYLSYFKVLETVARGKEKLLVLMTRYLPRATERAGWDPWGKPYRSVGVTDADLAREVYEQGRCAIAHAHGEPLIDPDDLSNTEAIYRQVRLVLALAELAIEEEHGVPKTPPPDWRPDWQLADQEGKPV